MRTLLLSSAVTTLFLISGCTDTGKAPAAAGRLTESNGCKTFDEKTEPETVSSGADCIVYRYDGESNTLALTHANACFNCCPGKIVSEVTIENNGIIITEAETEGYCDCLCLFDTDYEITDLSPGVYHITIKGLYVRDDPLEASIDCGISQTGMYCLKRDYYPWGL
ncbi:MAG: hypothetical protein JW881_20615 [Spirochaetales bacterium]|nr:hypothetical protein [Spirochaetales bacterium]